MTTIIKNNSVLDYFKIIIPQYSFYETFKNN